MESIVIGLPEYVIKKIVSKMPLILEVAWTGKPSCPQCVECHVRIKDSFWREIRNIRLHDRPSMLRVCCHKYVCQGCRRYFNTRLPGVKRWSRAAELLKKSVFSAYNKGYSNADIAWEHGIGVATVERYHHQMIIHKIGHCQTRRCPRILGIDEHRFTRKHGFVTTFCDLQKRKVVDVALGKDSSRLHAFLSSLQGRERVRVVCIDDMNSAIAALSGSGFPTQSLSVTAFM